MCTYLAKRGATYYFRRAVPAELRSVMGGRVEFMVSLKTKDRDAAKRLIPAHTLATDGLLTDAVAEVARAAPQSPGDAVEDTSAALTPGETEQAAFEAEEAEAAAYRYAARAAERLELRRKLATLQSVQLPMEMQAMRDLLREHQHHSYRMAEGKAAIMEARQLDANRAATDPAGPSPMLDPTVIYLWAAERKPTDKTVATHRAVVRWFYERIGNKGVADITRQDVLMFKAKLLADGTSTPNVKIKLSRLRTLLQWAADNDYAKENVAAGITIKDATQAKNKRIEFDLPALTRIFSSPVYAMASRPAGGTGEAAHWLPLLA
ncbi:MAG: hypothetical protein JWO65_1468, partial [Sphingomonas bacterium]|nr:hypothetical protein [Sphingomonas bacterium]